MAGIAESEILELRLVDRDFTFSDEEDFAKTFRDKIHLSSQKEPSPEALSDTGGRQNRERNRRQKDRPHQQDSGCRKDSSEEIQVLSDTGRRQDRERYRRQKDRLHQQDTGRRKDSSPPEIEILCSNVKSKSSYDHEQRKSRRDQRSRYQSDKQQCCSRLSDQQDGRRRKTFKRTHSKSSSSSEGYGGKYHKKDKRQRSKRDDSAFSEDRGRKSRKIDYSRKYEYGYRREQAFPEGDLRQKIQRNREETTGSRIFQSAIQQAIGRTSLVSRKYSDAFKTEATSSNVPHRRYRTALPITHGPKVHLEDPEALYVDLEKKPTVELGEFFEI